jgi:hypothetical protein
VKAVSTIRAKFVRDRPSLNSTRLWEEFNEAIQEHIISRLILTDQEVIIVAYFKSPNCWWLLSNKNLITHSDGLVQVIALSEIRKVELDAVFERNTSKHDANLIGLRLQNDLVQLELEKRAWPTIYNLLRFVISQ